MVARVRMAAGNGAAMRAAPLAFFLDPDIAIDRRAIRDVSRITHHNEEAYAGALAIVVAVRAAITGRWTDGSGLLSLVAEKLPDTRVRDRINELRSVGEASLIDVGRRRGSTGYVVDSVPLALFGAARHGVLGFTTMITSVVEVGGDTDTIASMAGQVAGAALGSAALPPEVHRLAVAPTIEKVALAIAEVTADLG